MPGTAPAPCGRGSVDAVVANLEGLQTPLIAGKKQSVPFPATIIEQAVKGVHGAAAAQGAGLTNAPKPDRRTHVADSFELTICYYPYDPLSLFILILAEATWALDFEL